MPSGKYSGSIVIPEYIYWDEGYWTDDGRFLPNPMNYEVTKLGDNCFSGCSDLTSIAIPKSIIKLGSNCFEGCTSLDSIIVSSDNTKFDSRDNCNAIIETGTNTLLAGCRNTTIPNSVTRLGDYCFNGCSTLPAITIPSSVTSVGKDCFKGGTYKIYCHPKLFNVIQQSYGYRACSNGAPIYAIGAGYSSQKSISIMIYQRTDVLYKPSEDFFAVEKLAYVIGHDTVSVSPTTSDYITVDDLSPLRSYEIKGFVRYSDGYVMPIGSRSYSTKGVSPQIECEVLSPTAVKCTGRFYSGVLNVNHVELAGQTLEPSEGVNEYTVICAGLDPSKSYTYKLTVNTEEETTEYATKQVITPTLELTTLQPRCVSSSCAIVAATTNISEDEPNVGFQWKKYDAPESLKPNEAYAAIYDGQLEGYLKRLQSTSYYNVRAFYKSNSETYYYSEWVTFDPSDFSYFEPTVHTYPVIGTTDCSASVRGYVLAGTDNITEQGFEYWETNGSADAPKLTKNAVLVPDAENINVVLSSGQVMQVVLDGLKPQTTYTYRAFVRTEIGTTYGEEQTFTTDVPTGIGFIDVEKDAPRVAGYYDLSGRKLNGKQRGIVIERYDDGTSRKVMVK